ncbi:TPA: hypothetical protein HA246_02615 [Candidatus Woesearchaeota archaeon]|nr:hypothetical protein [Candidatus Woesearchaeota archaeon]
MLLVNSLERKVLAAVAALFLNTASAEAQEIAIANDTTNNTNTQTSQEVKVREPSERDLIDIINEQPAKNSSLTGTSSSQHLVSSDTIVGDPLTSLIETYSGDESAANPSIKAFKREIAQLNKRTQLKKGLNREKYYVVTVNMFVDYEMRQNLGSRWARTLQQTIRYCNTLYGDIEMAGQNGRLLRFKLGDVSYLNLRNQWGKMRNDDNIIDRLVHFTSTKDDSLVLFFTGVNLYSTGPKGVRDYNDIGAAYDFNGIEPGGGCGVIEVPSVLVQRIKETQIKETVAHENGHLLGAKHSSSRHSVMCAEGNIGKVRGIDHANRERIRQYTLGAKSVQYRRDRR